MSHRLWHTIAADLAVAVGVHDGSNKVPQLNLRSKIRCTQNQAGCFHNAHVTAVPSLLRHAISHTPAKQRAAATGRRTSVQAVGSLPTNSVSISSPNTCAAQQTVCDLRLQSASKRYPMHLGPVRVSCAVLRSVSTACVDATLRLTQHTSTAATNS